MRTGTGHLLAHVSADSAVLTRELCVRLIDVSASGCLIESNRPIDLGTAATLSVELDGKEYEDDVQVFRCQAIAGAGATYRIGMRFLWPALLHERSIRHALAGRAGPIVVSNTTRVM